MRKLLGLAVALLVSQASFAGVKVGDKAPEIPAGIVDSEGKALRLSTFAAEKKYVVLEWLNHGCPFVRKHYDSGNMQKLQKSYTDKGVVWISVISSAKGKQGFSTAEEANADRAKYKASPTAILLDSEGKLGKEYGAATTPHMFVINPEGKIVYQGAIDDKPTTETRDISSAKNYVSLALDEAMKGQPVKTASTKAYGCSVKYQ